MPVLAALTRPILKDYLRRSSNHVLGLILNGHPTHLRAHHLATCTIVPPLYEILAYLYIVAPEISHERRQVLGLDASPLIPQYDCAMPWQSLADVAHSVCDIPIAVSIGSN